MSHASSDRWFLPDCYGPATYHHIDQGYRLRMKVCRPSGERQTLDIVSYAPRFDASGKKIATGSFPRSSTADSPGAGTFRTRADALLRQPRLRE